MQALKVSLCNPLDKPQRNQNPTVHALTELNARTRLGLDAAVHEYDALVQVRNCITHAAGIVKSYKYPQDLTTAIGRLVGFSIDGWHFIGRMSAFNGARSIGTLRKPVSLWSQSTESVMSKGS